MQETAFESLIPAWGCFDKQPKSTQKKMRGGIYPYLSFPVSAKACNTGINYTIIYCRTFRAIQMLSRESKHTFR